MGGWSIAPKSGRRFSVKAMRKQKAIANEPIHEIGSLL
jgi:hypothetical protein